MLFQPRAMFLGHEIDADSIHILADKIIAIWQWPPPKNVSEIKSFLDFVQFFHKSLKDLAAISYPLT